MRQYEVYLVDLEPTKGHEIQKIRPCVVISPNEMNSTIGTVIVAPMTKTSKAYPSRIKINFEKKKVFIVLDQIRTLDKSWLVKKLGSITKRDAIKVKEIIKEMLVD